MTADLTSPEARLRGARKQLELVYNDMDLHDEELSEAVEDALAACDHAYYLATGEDEALRAESR